jgi:hypothetical protein
LSEKVLIDLKKFLPKTKKGPWTHKKKLFWFPFLKKRHYVSIYELQKK